MKEGCMKYFKGFYWPNDVGTEYKASLKRVKSLRVAITLCKACSRTDTVIQAGGSIGVWPKELAKHFTTVFTFEPEPISFTCLAKNVTEKNVYRFPMALGNRTGVVGVRRRNLTSHKIEEDAGGKIPITRIDNLGLENCDAILLDVEGYERKVLEGALETIEKFHPLILVEAPALIFPSYGEKSEAEKTALLLAALGYNRLGHFEMDDIYEYNSNK